MRTHTCETCRYWVKNPMRGRSNEPKDDYGECHKYAPSPGYNPSVNDSGWRRAEWVRTNPSDWCGDYWEDGSKTGYAGYILAPEPVDMDKAEEEKK